MTTVARVGPRKVLVLGRDCRSFLSVIRSFGRSGFAVHTAWAPPSHPALASRYVARHHPIELPASVRPGLVPPGTLPAPLAALSDLIRGEAFDLVVPCNDESIVPLQAFRDLMHCESPIYLLNEPAYTTCASKARTHELAATLGLPVPYSELITRLEDLRRSPEDYPLPVVVKPVSSFEIGRLDARRSVSKVYQRDTLIPVIERALVHGPVLLQENVNGTGVGVEVLADRGELRVVFQHERVHEPLHGGGSSYRRSVPIQPELLAATRKLAAALQYHGVGMFEYKVDPRTGRWVLMEINGRFWGSLPLALAAGADFPLYLFQMLIEGRSAFPERFQTGLYCRNLVDDIEWFRTNLGADKNDATLATQRLSQVAAEPLHLLRGRERWDTVTLDDPRPGLVELGGWIGERLTEGRRRLRLLLEHTAPGRWLLGRRLRRAAAGARTVAFVCYGNICRSPFAARLARQLAGPAWEVLQGGIGVRPEDPPRPSPAIALQVARDHGVSLEDHRAEPAALDGLRRADVIFVFDDHNRRGLTERFPELASRVHFLGAARSDGPLVIADPDGGNRAAFEGAYQAIARALQAAGPSDAPLIKPDVECSSTASSF